MTATEQFFKAITDRWMNIAINAVLCVLFGALTFYAETWWGTVIFAWSSGAQFGFAAMWFVAPGITNRWRREMEAEIGIMMAGVFARIMRESYGVEARWGESPSPPTAPLH